MFASISSYSVREEKQLPLQRRGWFRWGTPSSLQHTLFRETQAPLSCYPRPQGLSLCKLSVDLCIHLWHSRSFGMGSRAQLVTDLTSHGIPSLRTQWFREGNSEPNRNNAGIFSSLLERFIFPLGFWASPELVETVMPSP